jgi:hypothetical protein
MIAACGSTAIRSGRFITVLARCESSGCDRHISENDAWPVDEQRSAKF